MKKKILFVLDLIIILIIYGLLYLLIGWIQSHNMPGLMAMIDVKKNTIMFIYCNIIICIFYYIFIKRR